MSNSLIRFNLATSELEILPPMAFPRKEHVLVTARGQLYVFGGAGRKANGVVDLLEGQCLNSVETFDVQRCVWASQRPMPQGLYSFVGASVAHPYLL